MSNSRKALRNFYKLPDEITSKAGSDSVSEAGSQSTAIFEDNDDEEELTQLPELDEENANIPEFVSKLAEEKSLSGLLSIYEQIRTEHAALASSQRELVNDNYKQLINAAEALEYLNSQGDLAGLGSMAGSVSEIADWVAKIPN